jgi:hypothetical protein
MEDWSSSEMNVKDLALNVGIYEDVIANELANFDPLIRLYPDYNILQILPELKKKYQTKRRGQSAVTIKADEYTSVADFVYQNMTMPGGIVDPNIILDKEQLKILRKLVNQELKK